MRDKHLTPWAELYASLANLKPGPLSHLEERRYLRKLTDLVTVGQTGIQANRQWTANALRPLLPAVRTRAQHWIGGLLDGAAVKPDRVHLGDVTWMMDRGVLRDDYPQAHQTLLGELVALLHARPFPFRRCGVCRRVFVRQGKREYCRAACAAKAKQQRDARDAAERARRSRAKRARRRENEQYERDKQQMAIIRAGGSLPKRRPS